MQTVLFAIQIVLAVALVGVVLVQRSEGGGLGMGGSGGMGGFLSGRGQANLLTRITAGLAAAFMVTSLALGLLARHQDRPGSILDGAGQATQEQQAPAEPVEPAEPAVPTE